MPRVEPVVELNFDLDRPVPKFVLFLLYHVALSYSHCHNVPCTVGDFIRHCCQPGAQESFYNQTPLEQALGSHWVERAPYPWGFGGFPAQHMVKCLGSGSDRNGFKAQLCCLLTELEQCP